MYLERQTYVKPFGDIAEHQVVITVDGTPLPPEKVEPTKVERVVEEVGYWRKANHVHKWFVDNVQNGKDDCGRYEVGPSQLVDLLERCRKILANRSLAEQLLPPQAGFFFGGTGIDEFYFQNLEHTVAVIEPVIVRYEAERHQAEWPPNVGHDGWHPFYWYEYHSSW